MNFHYLIRLLKPLNSNLNMNSRFRDMEKGLSGNIHRRISGCLLFTVLEIWDFGYLKLWNKYFKQKRNPLVAFGFFLSQGWQPFQGYFGLHHGIDRITMRKIHEGFRKISHYYLISVHGYIVHGVYLGNRILDIRIKITDSLEFLFPPAHSHQ